MGCGTSKPATATTGAAAAAGAATLQPKEKPPVYAATPAKQVPVETDGKLVDTTTSENTENASSRDTTPTHQKSEPNSRRNTGRSLETRRTNDSRKKVQQTELAGPTRDYTGCALEKRENDRLTHITTLASTILKAPCAFVILSAGDCMALASATGIDAEDDVWLPSFCAWALNQPSGALTIEDAVQDGRTSALTWTSADPFIKFYAGASVHMSTGERLGVLCVADFEPKPGSTALCMALPNLAEMVSRELPVVEEKPSAEALLFRAMDTYWDGSVLVDTTAGHWRIKYANEAFSNMTGIDRHKAVGRDLWDLVETGGSAATAKPWERHAAKTRKMAEFELLPILATNPDRPPSRHTAGSRELARRFKITMRPNTQQIMENYGCADSKDIEGWYFAVFTFLASNSRGSYTITQDPVEDALPFEGCELGPIIGKGSFGSVFRAVWGGKIVAIKVIEFGDVARVDAEGNPLEASLMLKLKHANIIETIQFTTQHRAADDAAETPQQQGNGVSLASAGTSGSLKASGLIMWLMLEYCDLGTLSDGVNSGLFHKELSAGSDKLGVPRMLVILETALDIATGLDFIHDHSILHGDLTAGNVLLASVKDERGKRNFQAKIADFGLSRQTITSKVETNTYGTVTHMPPELLNEGILSKAADVYAYGVLLYEMFTRKPVWEGLRHPQIIHAIAVQKKHPELPDTAPQNFKDLAYSCMAADAEERPNFKRIIGELQEMLKE